MFDRVEVYWNLHKKTWSVRSCATGRVLFHADHVVLTNVQFVVQPAGQAKVRRTGRKNVHAFARGMYLASNTSTLHGELARFLEYATRPEVLGTRTTTVFYNPYEHDTFMARWGDTDCAITKTKATWAVLSKVPSKNKAAVYATI